MRIVFSIALLLSLFLPLVLWSVLPPMYQHRVFLVTLGFLCFVKV